MREPLVRIRLDGNGRVYRPGETLSGEYRLAGIAPGETKAVEVSVLWQTEGKGDEDLAVHDFRRLSPEDGHPIDPRRPGRFSTVLPNSPLSYRGVIVKIRWCVRVRVFLTRGREVLGEVPFRLGEVVASGSASWGRGRGVEEEGRDRLSPALEPDPGSSDSGLSDEVPASSVDPAALDQGACEAPSPSDVGEPASPARPQAVTAKAPPAGESRSFPKVEAIVP